MNKNQINKLVENCLKTGNWMLRKSDAGGSHEGFQWSPIGEWTEAPDWNNKSGCGGGLHGNHFSLSSCYWTNRKDLDFCEIESLEEAIIMDNKIKVKKARVLLRNELPEGIKEWKGTLDLCGCDLSGITLPKKVNTLYLSGCNLSGITFPEKVNCLNLSGCNLSGITLPKEINSLDLSGCENLSGITLPEEVNTLDLRGCDISGITFPEKVNTLYLSGCNLSGITIPKEVNTLDLRGCDLSGITLPEKINTLDLSDCDLSGITLPKNVKVYY